MWCPQSLLDGASSGIRRMDGGVAGEAVSLVTTGAVGLSRSHPRRPRQINLRSRGLVRYLTTINCLAM